MHPIVLGPKIEDIEIRKIKPSFYEAFNNAVTINEDQQKYNVLVRTRTSDLKYCFIPSKFKLSHSYCDSNYHLPNDPDAILIDPQRRTIWIIELTSHKKKGKKLNKQFYSGLFWSNYILFLLNSNKRFECEEYRHIFVYCTVDAFPTKDKIPYDSVNNCFKTFGDYINLDRLLI